MWPVPCLSRTRSAEDGSLAAPITRQGAERLSVCFGSKADLATRCGDVRYAPESGH